jgi:hypothetical protein
MSLANMLTDAKWTKVSNGAAAGTTAVNSTHVDMTGFDAVMFLADLAAVVDGCILSLQAQDGALANDSDQANITNAVTPTFTAATSSNTAMILDVVEPQKQFVRVVLNRTTQNATVNSIWAVQYRTKVKPTVQPAASILTNATLVEATS